MEPVVTDNFTSTFTYTHPTFVPPFDNNLSVLPIHPGPWANPSDFFESYLASSRAPGGYVPGPSITDDRGDTRLGHVWCCNKWRKEGTMLTRHMKTKKHNPRVLCEADPECSNREAQRRDMYRHYWRAHKRWAETNKIPEQKKQCKDCGKWYARKDFWTRHRVNGTCPALRKRQRGGSSSPESSPSLPVRLLPKPSSCSPESSP
ncbi:hypothetical protein V8F20_004251 [Naviculisporaceae sp. PSN 640]